MVKGYRAVYSLLSSAAQYDMRKADMSGELSPLLFSEVINDRFYHSLLIDSLDAYLFSVYHALVVTLGTGDKGVDKIGTASSLLYNLFLVSQDSGFEYQFEFLDRKL